METKELMDKIRNYLMDGWKGKGKGRDLEVEKEIGDMAEEMMKRNRVRKIEEIEVIEVDVEWDDLLRGS